MLSAEETLFVPFLGQSNAKAMSWIFEPYKPESTANKTSGAIYLDRELTSILGSNIVTNDTRATNFSIGGSIVNGDSRLYEDRYVWWYLEQNKPGGALKIAEQGWNNWLKQQGAESTDEIAVIWSQGEADIHQLSTGDPAVRKQYKQSTNAIYDYLSSKFDYANITFYLTPTGRMNHEGATNRGLSPEQIATIDRGLDIIQEAQTEIALERDDVQLLPSYADLDMIYEEGQTYGDSYDYEYDRWSTDNWHLGHDGLKVNGIRIAQYIALNRGENYVLNYTDGKGNSADSIALSRAGLLDLNISNNASLKPIQGSNFVDVVVGTTAADNIFGKDGNDVIIASQGRDVLTGGAGNDVFFYDPLVYPDTISHADRILDFELGSDRLDVSELLKLSDYTGSNPIADSYITTASLNRTSLEVKFDADGAGTQAPSSLAILENVDSVNLRNELANILIITPTEF